MKTKSRETQEIVYESETTANKTQQYARKNLEELFVSTPLPLSDLLFNLGLFTRSSLLVKYIVMHEVYQRFVNLPGLIVEFGTWWGQNLVLLENLRAIHEPFNKQRHIIGFDTFTGYTSSGERVLSTGRPFSHASGFKIKDGKSGVWVELEAIDG